MLTYFDLKESYMELVTGDLPTSNESTFRRLLCEALEKIDNEGLIVGGTSTRIIDAVNYTTFTLFPTESSILQATSNLGQRVPIFDTFTYDTNGNTRNIMTERACLIDLHENEQGLRQYSIKLGGATGSLIDTVPIKFSIITAMRPPQGSIYDDSFWVDSLPIYPDCRTAIKSLLLAQRYAEMSNTESAMDYWNMGIKELTDFMRRRRQGTFAPIQIMNTSLNQPIVPNQM